MESAFSRIFSAWMLPSDTSWRPASRSPRIRSPLASMVLMKSSSFFMVASAAWSVPGISVCDKTYSCVKREVASSFLSAQFSLSGGTYQKGTSETWRPTRGGEGRASRSEDGADGACLCQVSGSYKKERGAGLEQSKSYSILFLAIDSISLKIMRQASLYQFWYVYILFFFTSIFF